MLTYFLLGAVSFTALTAAHEVHVSPSGSHGSHASLASAQQHVRELLRDSPGEAITVHIADGIYTLRGPLVFGSEDSGASNAPVTWKAEGSNAVVSGGLRVTDWKQNASSGIYYAAIPKGTQSRNLYVNGSAANYARQTLEREYFHASNTTYSWNATGSQYDWLMDTVGIAGAELRALSSFTDRYAPIKAVGDQELIMVQECWHHQVIGYDTFADPDVDGGLFVQNALALLDEGGEFYLDSEAGRIYYMPLEGEDMSEAEAYLGIQEALIAISGTLDDPVHDIAFEGLNFAHTTWLRPNVYGYVDQQTGGYIGENTTRPDFEAWRSHWYQMPSALQISAAHNISFTGGSYSQLGSGGFGIGNDANAHLTGIGLGAKDVFVRGGYFTQVMGNSITAGGIQIPAHHPNETAQINSRIHISSNIFHNTSSLFSSTVPILFTYVQDSSITHNDISHTPYSGLCVGYGWGMNDAGGSETYVDRGTYQFQPIFDTPTTAMNNLIQGNLIHDFGWSHYDLGGLYTLSKSPDTVFDENYIYDSTWYGIYTDEGSNSMIFTNNVFFSTGANGSYFGWYNPNQGYIDPGMHTANNTFIDSFGLFHDWRDFTNAPDGSGVLNNTFLRNWIVDGLADVTAAGHRVAYRAGIVPGERDGRNVSNDATVSDAFLALSFPTDAEGTILATIWNFDDAEMADIELSATVSDEAEIASISKPSTVPADGHGQASYQVTSSNCSPVFITVQATYTNTRIGQTGSVSANATLPGQRKLQSSYSMSSTWPAMYGQSCDTLGIRTGGRNLNGSYHDWAAIYKESSVGLSGSLSARVLSIDPVNATSKAGVVIRDSLVNDSPADDSSHVNATGYAAVFATASRQVVFAWDTDGNGYLNRSSSVDDVGLPVWVRVQVDGHTASGSYSTNRQHWMQIGENVTMPRNASRSDAGVLANSGGGFDLGTSIFADLHSN